MTDETKRKKGQTRAGSAEDIQQILHVMREEYWRGIEEADGEKAIETRDYLVFGLGGETYAVSTASAREVLRLPRLVRVPQVAEHILGVINLRGLILAVTDLRPLLGLPGRDFSAQARLVVVEAAGLTTALLVERVAGIRAVAVEAIEPATEGLGGPLREALAGQVAADEGLLLLLDLERILSRKDLVFDQKGE